MLSDAQFQQLIEMIGSAGDGAFWLSAFYFGYKLLELMVTAGAFAGFFGVGWYVAKRAFDSNGHYRMLRKLSKEAGMGTSFPFMHDEDLSQTVELIRKGKNYASTTDLGH